MKSTEMLHKRILLLGYKVLSNIQNNNLATMIFLNHRKLYSTHQYDPYRVLGISNDADEVTVKNAYIKLAKLYHPDRNPDDEKAKEKFIQIQNSYRLIMEKISMHDESGKFSLWYIYCNIIIVYQQTGNSMMPCLFYNYWHSSHDFVLVTMNHP